MTDQSNGDLAPTAASTPSTTARSGLTPGAPAAQRAAEQDRLHTPPPRHRGVPPPRNPNATRRPDWTDAHTGEGKFLAAQDARRAEAAAADAPGSQTERDPGAADRSADAAEPKYKIGDREFTEGEIAGLMERDALEKSRKLTLPATPDDYRAELPADFVTPQGVEFHFDPADPSLALARDFAHRHGLSQEQFSGMAAIYAASKVREIVAIDKAVKVEIGKLGAAGTDRVTAVQGWINAIVGPELGAAMNKGIFSAAIVKGFEKIMEHTRGQGGAGYTQTGRDPPKSRDDIPGYAGMTFEQKRAAQERAAGRR
jgi:hypothetical protein